MSSSQPLLRNAMSICPRMSRTSNRASYWCAASMNIRQSLVVDSDGGLKFLYNSLITSVNRQHQHSCKQLAQRYAATRHNREQSIRQPRLVRTTCRTKTANITKDDVTCALHHQNVTVLQVIFAVLDLQVVLTRRCKL